MYYFFASDKLKSSKTFAFNSSPLKSFATIFPEASNKKVVGICSTLYSFAIGSAHFFKFETCIQVILSFAIAWFQLSKSSSKETPTIFNPLPCNSLYIATTLGFSFLHGPHQEAQKSTMVTLPKDSLSETTVPCGVLAEKSGAMLPISAVVTTFFFAYFELFSISNLFLFQL